MSEKTRQQVLISETPLFSDIRKFLCQIGDRLLMCTYQLSPLQQRDRVVPNHDLRERRIAQLAGNIF